MIFLTENNFFSLVNMIQNFHDIPEKVVDYEKYFYIFTTVFLINNKDK